MQGALHVDSSCQTKRRESCRTQALRWQHYLDLVGRYAATLHVSVEKSKFQTISSPPFHLLFSVYAFKIFQRFSILFPGGPLRTKERGGGGQTNTISPYISKLPFFRTWFLDTPKILAPMVQSEGRSTCKLTGMAFLAVHDTLPLLDELNKPTKSE